MTATSISGTPGTGWRGGVGVGVGHHRLHSSCPTLVTRAGALPEPLQAALGVALGLRRHRAGTAPDRFVIAAAPEAPEVSPPLAGLLLRERLTGRQVAGVGPAVAGLAGIAVHRAGVDGGTTLVPLLPTLWIEA